MERDGYVPFKLGVNGKSEENNIMDSSDFYSLLKIKDYTLVSHIIQKDDYNKDEKNTTIRTIDSNGVVIDRKETNGDYTMSIKNKNGKKLGEFDEKTKTVTYSDDTTETLF